MSDNREKYDWKQYRAGDSFHTKEIVKIKNTVTQECVILTPKAVESCMRPGEFMISPIVFTVGEIFVTIQGEQQTMKVALEDLVQGKVVVEEERFCPRPAVPRRGCKPCTELLFSG